MSVDQIKEEVMKRLDHFDGVVKKFGAYFDSLLGWRGSYCGSCDRSADPTNQFEKRETMWVPRSIAHCSLIFSCRPSQGYREEDWRAPCVSFLIKCCVVLLQDTISSFAVAAQPETVSHNQQNMSKPTPTSFIVHQLTFCLFARSTASSLWVRSSARSC